MWVARGAVVTLRQSTVTHCDYGLVAGENETRVAEPCGICGRSGDEALAHAFHVLRGAARPEAGVRGPLCAHQGAVARACLEDVDVSGCDEMAVFINVGGVVTARNVRVHTMHPGRGIYLHWAGECRSSFEGCSVVAPSGVGVLRCRQLQPPTVGMMDVEGQEDVETVVGPVDGIEVQKLPLDAWDTPVAKFCRKS